MGTVTPPDGTSAMVAHLDLLASAHRVQAAAVAGDHAALRSAAERLARELRRHVDDERPSFDGLPAAVGDLVRRGQDRLLELADAIADDARTDRRCTCLSRSAELAAALRRQSAVEAAAAVHDRAQRARFGPGPIAGVRPRARAVASDRPPRATER